MDSDREKLASVPSHRITLPVRDYDLGLTLSSGQAFRWQAVEGEWEGVIRGHWVSLKPVPGGIVARTARPVTDWDWLRDYLRADEDLNSVVSHFPRDPAIHAALAACPGLRLLRQDPWECLASFILSSTKQIVQIQQIVAKLCERWGEAIPTADGDRLAYAFPSAETVAALEETDLRECKMGFRAAYLLQTARIIAEGKLDLEELSQLTVGTARERLESLPGVGPKIADCVLLFGYGFQEAFPVDVWILKALQQLYFPKRQVTLRQMREFSRGHFGRFAGYAQQYLFHYMRTQNRQ